ncbi:hypothetical protein LguiA_006408 [Lonicera macranthoides]
MQTYADATRSHLSIMVSKLECYSSSNELRNSLTNHCVREGIDIMGECYQLCGSDLLTTIVLCCSLSPPPGSTSKTLTGKFHTENPPPPFQVTRELMRRSRDVKVKALFMAFRFKIIQINFARNEPKEETMARGDWSAPNLRGIPPAGRRDVPGVIGV